MAGEYLAGLKSQLKTVKAYERARVRLTKFIGLVQSHLKSKSASHYQWTKAAARKLKEGEERDARKALEKLENRMIQLAKMPKNRGASAYKRIAEGGALKESAQEKKLAARKAQLKAMPNGRGTVDHAKLIAAANSQAKRKLTTMTQPGKAGKKSPGLADTTQNDKAKASRAASAKKAAAAQKKQADIAAKQKAAAEAKKKAEMARKLAIISGAK